MSSIESAFGNIQLMTVPTAIFAARAHGPIHWKLTGSSPVSGLTPKIGPEKAIRVATVVPHTLPTRTPAGFANGTNRAKKNRQKMGVTSNVEIFVVTAVMFPGTDPMNELPNTTVTPIASERSRAIRTCPFSVWRRKPKRSRKSVRRWKDRAGRNCVTISAPLSLRLPRHAGQYHPGRQARF